MGKDLTPGAGSYWTMKACPRPILLATAHATSHPPSRADGKVCDILAPDLQQVLLAYFYLWPRPKGTTCPGCC